MDTIRGTVTASGALENIPEELRRLRQWVVWKYEERDGKLTKVPYNPKGGAKASVRDSETWGTFEEAVAKLGAYDGLGLVFTEEDPYTGVDLDAKKDERGDVIGPLIDPGTGKLVERAREIVEDLGGYAEVSPSGAGVHAIVRGKAPNKRRGQVEAYSSGRYFTFTGEAIRGAGEEIPHRQEELDALAQKYLEKPQKPVEVTRSPGLRPASPGILDEKKTTEHVLEIASRAKDGPDFLRLWRGDISGFPSQSEADESLASRIAFYTGPDPDAVDRIFRDSSLMRPKWDKKHYADGRTYGQGTCEKAIDRDEFYTFRGARSRNAVTQLRRIPETDNDPGEASESVRALAFLRADLAGALKAGVEPPEVLVEDNLLRGKVHCVYSVGGTGKTFYAAYLARRVLADGGKVVYFDQENGLRIMAERAEALGITPEMAERLYFFPFPTMPLDLEVIEAFEELLDEIEPDLVIFDSWVNHLSMCGLDENSNTDIATWSNAYSSKCRHREIAALILDHVPKDGDTARGAGRKRDYVDVMWYLKNPQPFSRGAVGRVELHLRKDREGWLPSSLTYAVGGGEKGFIFRPSSGTVNTTDDAGLTNKERDTLEGLGSFGNLGAFDADWKDAAAARDVGKSKYYQARKRLLELELVEKDMGKFSLTEAGKQVLSGDAPEGPSGPPSGLQPVVEGGGIHSEDSLQNRGPFRSTGRPVDLAGEGVQSSPPPLRGGLTGRPVDKKEEEKKTIVDTPPPVVEDARRPPGEAGEVAALFEAFPRWLEPTLNRYLEDRSEENLRSLCVGVAVELYDGDQGRWPEIRDEVERALASARRSPARR